MEMRREDRGERKIKCEGKWNEGMRAREMRKKSEEVNGKKMRINKT